LTQVNDPSPGGPANPEPADQTKEIGWRVFDTISAAHVWNGFSRGYSGKVKMGDLIGANRYNVAVRPVQGSAKREVLNRIQLMEKQAHALLKAVAQLRHAMQQHTAGSQRTLVSAVMDSRNQALEIVMSHMAIQIGLYESPSDDYGRPGMGTSQPTYVEMLFNRAAKEGLKQGEALLDLR
jgi:hypothetical protein